MESMPPLDQGEVTQLLGLAREGREDAVDKLMELVYDELRRLATNVFRRERAEHTLQPTALVHEAYLRLLGPHALQATNKNHFRAIAGVAMRRVLVDHARRKTAEKRNTEGGPVLSISADNEDLALAISPDVDVLELHDALERMGRINERQARLVEMRVFAGMTQPEVADALGVSLATAERDWKIARVWLRKRLMPGAEEPED